MSSDGGLEGGGGRRIKGSVKWFSNRKGYGFITPLDENDGDDIFVHQSVIYSEGYRTLDEGWEVEFSVGTDDDGKIKAENVTAIGGGPCAGPRSSASRRNHNKREGGNRTRNDEDSNDGENDRDNEEAEEEEYGGGRKEGGRGDRRGGGGRSGGSFRRRSGRNNANSSSRNVAKSFWHDVLSLEVTAKLNEKAIRMTTGTIDVSFGNARVKLGTRGYASMAHGDGMLAEGSFVCDSDGLATLEWKRGIYFDDEGGQWKPLDLDAPQLVSTLNLNSESVVAVGVDETSASLWGDAPTDPRSALEENGFEMRRVVLTTKRR